jgi:hypothetical protein
VVHGGIAVRECARSAFGESLDSSVQKHLREATFEVGKPESDPLSYEKPLPLDLLPFAERTGNTDRSVLRSRSATADS